MNTTTYLAIYVIEECAEVIVRVCKALRFGWHEVQPGQELDNKQRFSYEFCDLWSVLEMLRERVDLPNGGPEMIDAKKKKVAQFMGYSRTLGILDEDIPAPQPCRWCDVGEARVPSSVSDEWVHPATPIGRVLCTYAAGRVERARDKQNRV